MPYTIEDALTEVGNVVRRHELTGDVAALLEAAKVADARYQETPRDQDQGARLARTLLIAVWALHAEVESGGEYHPEEDFEYAAYGSAG